MCKFQLIHFCFVLSCVFVDVKSFNLDTVNFVKHRGDQGSMFGFSVATHRDRDTSWVIVGAPEGETSQPGVIRGGAVYRCQTDRDDGCQELPFDRNGNVKDSADRQIDQKSFQWFGATVNSGGPDKPIVACAPRYVWFSMSNTRRDPVGTCFLAKGDFTDFQEYSPCRTKNWGYHRQGACQAGLGAAVSKDGETLFVGAPGSWYWQGQMYSLDPRVSHPYSSRYSEYGAGQAYGQSLRNRPSVLATKEGSPVDDDSYMGYSLAVGDFTGDGQSGVAIGMPRGNRLVGKVVLYTWNLTNHQNITGAQLGAYFGYSLAAADLDGDGFDDLVIGAPLHTETNNEGKYEIGRVYVVYQRSELKGKFRRLHTRDGINSKGRFGLSLASLGDLDLDGYDDIAIGAPYDGPNERGAVYIYYGSREGIREKPSQIIHAEDISQTDMYTFGFSLSGNNIDLDNNQYPDMVVGAYLSNTAFVFKSRPVINVTASVLFSIPNKIISLEEKGCSLRNGERVTCTEIKSCFHYNGTGVNRAVDLEVQFILDTKNQKDPRMFFLNHERQNSINQTWRLEYKVLNCNSARVYIKEGARDKLTPLEVEMRYDVRDPPPPRRSPTGLLPPVLNRNVQAVHSDSVTIRKNCGMDDICIPDLRLISSPNVEKYLLGSNKRLEVDVIVQNEGEDSFESMFYMKLPPGVNFFKTERIDDSANIPVQCSAPTSATNHTLKCDIGNPLPSEKMVHFKVLLDPFHQEGMKPSYDFLMAVNSTNPEENSSLSDNKKHLSIDIWVETDLSLTGWPVSPDVHYNASLYNAVNYTLESEIGPQIVHIYSLRNNGPSNINEAEALFIWPEYTLAGDDLLYLLEQPETSGPIKCDFAFANPLKVDFAVDRRKSYIELNGLKVDETGAVTIEESSASGSSSSISTSSSYNHSETHHGNNSKIDRKKVEEEEKIDESGDGSFVHINRGKEVQKAERNPGGGSGSTKVTVSEDTGEGSKVILEKTYTSWNSSSVNGGPVITHSWNKTTHTDSDGVTKETEFSNQNQGSAGNANRYKIHYTSSGSKSGQDIGNRYGSTVTSQGSQKSKEDGSETQFSISGQDSTGQFSSERSGSHHSGTHQNSNVHGSSGTDHHSSESRTQGQHFNWNGPKEHSGQTGEASHQGSQHGSRSGSRESNHQHQTGSEESRTRFGSSETNQGANFDGLQLGSGAQRGSHRNATHRHSWSIDQQGAGRGEKNDSDGIRRYNSFVTEESVNQGLDDYTQGVLTYGATQGSHNSQTDRQNERGHAHGSQESHRSQTGGRDRSSYGRYNQTDYDASAGLGAAAIGGGFRTTSLDLGVVGNANVDESISGHADKNFGKDKTGESNYDSQYSSETYYDPDLGAYEDRQYGSGGQGHGSITYGTSRTYSGGRHGSAENQGQQGRGSGTQGLRSYQSHYSSSGGTNGQGGSRTFESHSSRHNVGDNVPTEYPMDLDHKNYQRHRRQADDDISQIMPCTATKCRTLRCMAGPLEKDQEVWVVLRFRANVQTLKKVGAKQPIVLSSMMLSRINKLPYIGTPNERPVHSHEVFTTVTPTETEIKTKIVPLWAVVLSACAGTLILLLLIFLLYKCGFFKRNRPSDAPERQPLNRNGHYNGDEAL